MVFFTSLQSSYQKNALGGLLSKMFPGSLTVMAEKISKYSYKRWMNSGTAFRGEYLMQNILEHPSEDVECTLSQVIEHSSLLRFFLNVTELQSLIARASDRGKSLPKDLEKSIKNQIYTLSNTPGLAESIQLDRKLKDSEMMEKPTRWIPEEVQMLSVRRMTPSEYETLQGFPKGWTAIDSEQ